MASVTLDTNELRWTRDLVMGMLPHVSGSGLFDVLDAVCEHPPRDASDLAADLAAELETRELLEVALVETRIAAGGAWRAADFGLALTAHLLEARGDRRDALSAWEELAAGDPTWSRRAHLECARLQRHLGEADAGYAHLRAALQGESDFRALSLAARILHGLQSLAPVPCARRARIALLSSTTTDALIPLLEVLCYRDGIDVQLYASPYGAFRQAVLDESSELHGFEPDFVIIATHWRDAGLQALSDDPEGCVEHVVEQFDGLWERLVARHGCRVIQHGFDIPQYDPYGHLSGALLGGRCHILREVNQRLRQVAPPSVAVLDLESAATECEGASWSDPAYWHLAKQHPATAALPVLAEHQVALVRAGLGLTRKVLVLDLDNTLWGGVVGEEGVHGIVLGPPSPAGEAYQAVQQYAKELRARGVILAVCSKNNEQDARAPFVHHEAMILALDDITVFQANWVDKPSNLRHIARALNVGLDSLVFLDDSPIERALVRRETPEVLVPELGRDPALYVRALARTRAFEAWALSGEDTRRHELYRSNVLREGLRQASVSLEGFLLSLDMEAEAGPFGDDVLARVVQLIGKTNQFNLTTRRHSEQAVRRIMEDGAHWTQHFRLKDRFGDNGLVGVMIALAVEHSEPMWEVDTWLMSCRVIGREMEQLMLHRLVTEARQRGIRRIRGVYVPTPKNEMVADLYPRLGFAASDVAADDRTIFELDVEHHGEAAPGHIRLLADGRRRTLAGHDALAPDG